MGVMKFCINNKNISFRCSIELGKQMEIINLTIHIFHPYRKQIKLSLFCRLLIILHVRYMQKNFICQRGGWLWLLLLSDIVPFRSKRFQKFYPKKGINVIIQLVMKWQKSNQSWFKWIENSVIVSGFYLTRGGWICSAAISIQTKLLRLRKTWNIVD